MVTAGGMAAGSTALRACRLACRHAASLAGLTSQQLPAACPCGGQSGLIGDRGAGGPLLSPGTSLPSACQQAPEGTAGAAEGSGQQWVWGRPGAHCKGLTHKAHAASQAASRPPTHMNWPIKSPDGAAGRLSCISTPAPAAAERPVLTSLYHIAPAGSTFKQAGMLGIPARDAYNLQRHYMLRRGTIRQSWHA